MGQKTNPIGNRLGIIRGWESNWYGGKNYGDKIAEDDKIRKYVNARLFKASVSRVIIERTLKLVTVTITTARPGIIIGKGGQEVDKLKEELNPEIMRAVFKDSGFKDDVVKTNAVQILKQAGIVDVRSL